MRSSSTMSYKGQTNTLSLPDHDNRIQVTFTPLFGTQQQALGRGQEHPQARPMGQADQPHQPDPRAGRPDRAEQVRDQDDAGSRPVDRRAGRPVSLQSGRAAVAARAARRPLPAQAPRRPISARAGHVLVLATLGAPERRLLSRSANDLTLNLSLSLSPVSDRQGDDHRRRRARSPSSARGPGVARAAPARTSSPTDLAVLNRALHAFRLVDRRSLPQPVARRQALVARVGFGAGEQVADGLWTEARELTTASRVAAGGPRCSAPRPGWPRC